MIPMLQLPRVQFDFGAVKVLPDELAALGVGRPLLLTDKRLAASDVFGRVRAALGNRTDAAVFVADPENPPVAGVARALYLYRAVRRPGVVAGRGCARFARAEAAAPLAPHGGGIRD